MNADLGHKAFAAFATDVARAPKLSLRGGNAVDEYKEPEPYSPVVDVMTDAYLENNFWGVAHLDTISWRHYLPHLIDYSLRHFPDGGNVTDALLASLRPPDREPPRLATITPEQEAVIVAFLEYLAFAEGSKHQDLATQVLEEWWVPNALYRKSGAQQGAPADGPRPAGSGSPRSARRG